MVTDGTFSYETCLLKHHVRTTIWLPFARERLATIRSATRRATESRRLRYFTFCAVGAIDVLMLDIAQVVRRSNNGRFDTVYFFDRSEEYALETQRRIPGAVGFVGDFVSTVLLGDPEEDFLADTATPLSAPMLQPDEHAVRDAQRRRENKRNFVQSFPFDVLNLDLEELLFKDHDEYPGRLLNALRRVFRWQQRPLRVATGRIETLEEFTLFFTTQVGPLNLSDEYREKLEGPLRANMSRDNALRDILVERAGSDDLEALRRECLELFFRIALPKVLAATLLENDWYVVPDPGVVIYEFERDSTSGPYTMLHLGMHIRRKVPPADRRGPGEDSPIAIDAYTQVVRQIFRGNAEHVTLETIDTERLKADLQTVFARRRKYFPDDETPEIP